MILFQLGRQPEISLAELQAVYGTKPQPIARRLASLDISEAAALTKAPRLGGTIKLMSVMQSDLAFNESSVAELIHVTLANAWGKATIGLSLYGFGDHSQDVRLIAQTARQIGAIAKQVGEGLPNISSVRILLDNHGQLSTATILHNGLARQNPKKIELNFIKAGRRVIVARTLYVQDIDSYTTRDRRRPRRDARNGMLPPKLAQIIINLALGASHLPSDTPLTLLDPFCGTGVVLQEAALMRSTNGPLFSGLVGSDLASKMIDYTKVNLDWLAQHHPTIVNAKLTVADATNGHWSGVSLVATEAYLGAPYVTTPPPDKLKQNIHTCDLIIAETLSNLSRQLPHGAGLCLAVPCWHYHGRIEHLPSLARATDDDYLNLRSDDLVYRRPDQIVGRKLLVLRRR